MYNFLYFKTKRADFIASSYVVILRHGLQIRAIGFTLQVKKMCKLIKIPVSRILEVSKFEETDKNHIFSVIDAFIAKRKIQSIL